MNKTTYLRQWQSINSDFMDWFNLNGSDWPGQKKYLSREINKNFKISQKNVSKIFKQFDSIFPDDLSRGLDWDKYQLPTLISITINYIKL